MTDSKTVATASPSGGMQRRSPREIAEDATLSKARRIELLKIFKHHHAAPQYKAIIRDADVELDKLMTLNSMRARP